MDRTSFLNDLKEYKTKYEQENAYVRRFQDLLFFDNCFERSLTTGHLTASAWVLNADFTKVLLLHHRKLDRWLQPGGHADGDEDLFYVAKKELKEETGITKILKPAEQAIFDLDIHSIPARKDVAEHEHYDVRFAFIALVPDELQKNEESKQLKWIELSRLEEYIDNEPSILRMRDKTTALTI